MLDANRLRELKARVDKLTDTEIAGLLRELYNDNTCPIDLEEYDWVVIAAAERIEKTAERADQTINDDRLQEIKTRADAAFGGEWRGTDGYSDQVLSYLPDGSFSRIICDVRGWGYLTGKGHGALHLTDEQASAQMQADVNFIANARQDIPWMIELIESLIQELENPKPLKGKMRIGQIVTGKVVALDAERGLASIKRNPYKG